jgi:hypothetical protein
MRALHATVTAAAIAVLLMAGSAQAAATAVSIPLSQVATVECADGGVGELVQLSGSLQIVLTTTFDAAGGIHTYSHFNPQGVSGVGLSSRTTYRGAGVTMFQLNQSSGIVQTAVNTFLLIGSGKAPNLRVQENLVFVLNPNGTVTAAVDNVRVTCT